MVWIQLDLTSDQSKMLEELRFDFRLNSKSEVIKHLLDEHLKSRNYKL